MHDRGRKKASQRGKNSGVPSRRTLSEIVAQHGIDIGLHMQRSERDQTFCCLYEGCLKSYRAREDAVSHVFKHLNIRPYRCSQCEMTFSGRGDMKYHLVTHNKRFACDICTKVFATLPKLRVHSRIHTGDKPFVCDACGFRTNLASTLKSHKNIHGNARPYGCPVVGCTAAFTFAGQLRRHRELDHGENSERRSCQICCRSFKTSADLGKAFRTF